MSSSISIVVPSFNQAQWLGACLDSILNQNYPELEVIVIDGGSVDNSLEVIKRYEPYLTYWVSEPDRGQSHALNKGMTRATGVWLTWLNSDDLLLPGSLLTLKQHISDHPTVEWWIGNGWCIDASGTKFNTFSGPRNPINSPSDLCPWTDNWIPQPGSFFTRELFNRSGGYIREDLHYAMDAELWLRFLKNHSPGKIEFDMAAYRFHDCSKTVTMMPSVEVEIVKAFSEQLGLDRALERVRWLAENYYTREEQYQKLSSKIKPLVRLASFFKKLGFKF